MKNAVWKPSVTVAAVIEREGRFLLVEEEADGRCVYNQPAGQLPLRSLVGDPTKLHHGATRISFRHLGLMTAAVMSVVRTEIANANAATSG